MSNSESGRLSRHTQDTRLLHEYVTRIVEALADGRPVEVKPAPLPERNPLAEFNAFSQADGSRELLHRAGALDRFAAVVRQKDRVAVDEMRGLGVLARSGSDYRLRSPNLVRLMGSESDIISRILELSEQPRDVKYDEDIDHRLWRGQAALLLPFLDSIRLDLCAELTSLHGRDWPIRWKRPIAVDQEPGRGRVQDAVSVRVGASRDPGAAVPHPLQAGCGPAALDPALPDGAKRARALPAGHPRRLRGPRERVRVGFVTPVPASDERKRRKTCTLQG